jgi:hypothetical protein
MNLKVLNISSLKARCEITRGRWKGHETGAWSWPVLECDGLLGCDSITGGAMIINISIEGVR